MHDNSPLVSARKTPSPVDGKPPIRRKDLAQFHSLAGPGNAVLTSRSMYNMRGPEAAAGVRALSPTSRQPAAAFPVALGTPLPAGATSPHVAYATPTLAPERTPVPAGGMTPPSGPSEEVVQLQKEMEALKGDMKDIKKLLGNILVKMK